MNTAFLHQSFLGNTIQSYILFVVILLVALFLKRYISAIFTKLFFTLFRKFSTNFFGQKFNVLVLQPVEGLIVTVFFYVAFFQLRGSLDKAVVFHRVKPALDSGGEVTTMLVTVMEVIDHLGFLFFLFYFVMLISRITDFLFLVLVHKAVEKGDKERQQILPLIRDVLKVVIWSFGILSVLGVVFHVNVAALVAGLGVGGIAIAFAAKDSLENLMASFMVLLDKPFIIGDWIKVAGVEGNVEKVGFRSTRIRTFDKSLISVPNRKMIDGNLENLSERGTRRVLLTVGAVYGLSKNALEATINEIKNDILKVNGTTGNPIVHLDSFADSSVNIQIIYFVEVKPEYDFVSIKQQVLFNIYESMYRHANGFAFPTQLTIEGQDMNDVIPKTNTDNKE